MTEIKVNPPDNLFFIKQAIQEVIHYKKDIIFFGSRANGVSGKDSDYDLLVLIHQNDIDRKKMSGFQAKIKRLCAKAGIDADILVRDYRYALEMQNFPGNIIHSAFQTGINVQ